MRKALSLSSFNVCNWLWRVNAQCEQALGIDECALGLGHSKVFVCNPVYYVRLFVYLYHILFALHIEFLYNVSIVAKDLCSNVVPIDGVGNLLAQMFILGVYVYFH